MNIFVKEMLYLLDYNDNVLDTLFISTDKKTPGYAYDINIKDYNTGHSDLSFKMPSCIIDENGISIPNPKLQHLTPLSKIRYNRIITYMGDESVTIPVGNNDLETFPKNDGTNPKDYEMENYIMDYIIEPLDKDRQNMGIYLNYIAIDFPRFNLSKKKLGLTFNEQIITDQSLSLYQNEPMSVPGRIQYVPWSVDLAIENQCSGSVITENELAAVSAQPGELYYAIADQALFRKKEDGTWERVWDGEPILTTWEPNPQNGAYPLDDASIKRLIKKTSFSTEFTYGSLATIFYWPVTKTERFEGVHYEKGGFITLSFYNTYEGSDWVGSEYLNQIAWKWGYLEPVQHYLGPNTASNYLRYILKNTNWKVKGDKSKFIKNTDEQPWFTEANHPATGEEGQYHINYYPHDDGTYDTIVFRYTQGVWADVLHSTLYYLINRDINDPDFGTLYDVDIEQVEVSRSNELSYGEQEFTDACYNVKIDNSNCYNAIMATAKLFNLYPIFDCVNKTVTLKINVGKNYGLTYRYKSNLKNDKVKLDGEKVITKLYVTGGLDAQGSRNINISTATRTINADEIYYVSQSMRDSEDYHLMDDMATLQNSAYDNMMGKILANGVDMKNQPFKLNFPDNLYEKYLNNITSSNTIEKTLIKFQNGHKIDLLYNPTTTDKCFYIYENDGSRNYANETMQLYKFSIPDMSLRRNLTEYKIHVADNDANGGKIASIDTNIQTIAGVSVTNYMKYIPPLMDGIIKDGNTYRGNAIDNSWDDAKTNLLIQNNQTLVIKGPDRVYIVPNNKEDGYVYTLGNVYYREKDGYYYFCAGEYFAGSGEHGYNKNIAISGFDMIKIGKKTDIVKIDITEDQQTVLYHKVEVTKLNGQKLSFKELFSSGFAIRIKRINDTLVEADEFNPNNQEFLIGRSPYGESYIYNFKYLYDNNLITKDQILDIYRISTNISNTNLEYYDKYEKEMVATQAKLDDAYNNYDLFSSRADAQLEALMSQYWRDPNRSSLGQFSAFPYMPKFTSGNENHHYSDDKKMYWEDITYDVPDGEGNTTNTVVKRVYFNVFGKDQCLDLYPHCEDNQRDEKNPEVEGLSHTVMKALGWDENKISQFTLDKPLPTYTESEDPGKTADNYNKCIKRMKEYYYRAMIAEQDIDKYTEKLKQLLVVYNQWQKEIEGYEKYLQENYGQYIIEGSYSNPEQPYSNLLLDDGLEASDKYATPNVTYQVGVMDQSGLIEYRAPQLYKYNLLVKKLYNVGQVAPHVGDFVAIQDEPMGMFGVPGLITTITRRVDDPYQNNITIDTAYSDSDELVGNIITATNTTLSNKDIYGRAAIINNKGELSSSTINNALSTGRNSVSIISTNGKVVVDNNGLTCVNPDDKQKSLRYNGTGVFATNNNGVTWRELLTPYGINANYLNAGTIDANKITITDGSHGTTVLNGKGLVVKENANQPYVIGSVDENGADENWKNVSVFVGRDQDNHGIGYFKGYINASKGGNIGGWIIKSDGLYNIANNAYLTPNANNNILKVTDNFYVEKNGVLHATGAQIDGSGTFSGKLIVTDDSSQLNKGEIAGFDASDNGLTNGDTIKLSPSGVSGTVNNHNDRWAIYSKGNFGVTTNGKLYATGADISGHIDANSGKIGSFILDQGKLYSGDGANRAGMGVYNKEWAFWAGGEDSSTAPFHVGHNGTLTATSGSVGGFTLGTVSFSGSTAKGTMTIQRGNSAYVNFPANGGRLMIGSTADNGVALTTANKMVISDEYGDVPGEKCTSYDKILIKSKNGDIRLSAAHDGDQRACVLLETKNSKISIGNNIALTTSGYAQIKDFYFKDKKIYFTGITNEKSYINSGGTNFYFVPGYTSEGYGTAYIGTGDNKREIMTRAASASTLSVKKNLKNIQPLYNTLYEDLQSINMYDYDYKYKNANRHCMKDYGFIIDEIENTKLLKNYFKNTPMIRYNKNGILFDEIPEGDNNNLYTKVETKEWLLDSYVKGIFIIEKVLQQKIDQLNNKIHILENKIKKEKIN